MKRIVLPFMLAGLLAGFFFRSPLDAAITTAVPGPSQPTVTNALLNNTLPANYAQTWITFVMAPDSPPIGLGGDFNNDGVVNSSDYLIWRQFIGPTHLPQIYMCFQHVQTLAKDVRVITLQRLPGKTNVTLSVPVNVPAALAVCFP